MFKKSGLPVVQVQASPIRANIYITFCIFHKRSYKGRTEPIRIERITFSQIEKGEVPVKFIHATMEGPDPVDTGFIDENASNRLSDEVEFISLIIVNSLRGCRSRIKNIQ